MGWALHVTTHDLHGHFTVALATASDRVKSVSARGTDVLSQSRIHGLETLCVSLHCQTAVISHWFRSDWITLFVVLRTVRCTHCKKM